MIRKVAFIRGFICVATFHTGSKNIVMLYQNIRPGGEEKDIAFSVMFTQKTNKLGMLDNGHSQRLKKGGNNDKTR